MTAKNGRIVLKRAHGSNKKFHYNRLFIKKIVALMIISYQVERKINGKKLFNCFETSKNIISKISGRLLIGQNDSLDVLLLVDFFL